MRKFGRRSAATAVVVAAAGGWGASPLWLMRATAAPGDPAPAARGVQVSGAILTPRTFTPDDLRQEPATVEPVYFSTGKGPVQATFTGVLLWSLLQEAAIKPDPDVKNDIARRTILVTGSDGYATALSVGEIDPEFGGGLALLAYARDGQPLPDGGVRLVVPGDKNGGRSVQDVVSVEVR